MDIFLQCCRKSVILICAEHDLNAVTAFNSSLAISDSLLLTFVERVHGMAFLTSANRLQAPFSGSVTYLCTSHEEVQGPSVDVENRVQVSVNTVLRPSIQAATSPFCAARLDAVRCVLKYVTSIMAVFSP